jgi:hypothetical protein
MVNKAAQKLIEKLQLQPKQKILEAYDIFMQKAAMPTKRDLLPGTGIELYCLHSAFLKYIYV